jgi:hypothetical protein
LLRKTNDERGGIANRKHNNGLEFFWIVTLLLADECSFIAMTRHRAHFILCSDGDDKSVMMSIIFTRISPQRF